jgi:broad specificity phosphatase PhoE
MTTFLLIRHASHDLLGRTLAGWMPGVHLNELGRAEAERLADRLVTSSIDSVYSSPLDRSIETARPIAARIGCDIEIRETLGEFHFGSWTGRSFADLEGSEGRSEFNTSRSDGRAPGGESMLEVQHRVLMELARIRAAYPDSTVAIVSHGDVLKAAVAHVLGLHLDYLQRFELAPASVTRIAWNDWGPLLVGLNETPAATAPRVSTPQ